MGKAVLSLPSLLSELRHSILKSLVTRKCLQAETANLLESWPLDRSGFSAFVGDPISQPGDRPRLKRVLNYIFRPSMPYVSVWGVSYVESTGLEDGVPANADCVTDTENRAAIPPGRNSSALKHELRAQVDQIVRGFRLL